MDRSQALAGLNFGRVDAETDFRFDSCFIGTEMLRQILLPQHSLVLGSKGSGKSAAFRLMSNDVGKIKHLLPKGYNDIFCIPAYGLQSEEFMPGIELRELKGSSVDDFRYFWLLYLGIKTVSTLSKDDKIQKLIATSKNDKLRSSFKTILGVLGDLDLIEGKSAVGRMRQKFTQWMRPTPKDEIIEPDGLGKMLSIDFRHRTGMSIMALLDHLDLILRETKCLAWIMLDKLDLLFIDDFEKLRAAITGLVQLLVEYSNRFKNIHFKIFLRNDIYRQLHIVNKSHLVSYTNEMKWRDGLLLKLLVSRAVADSDVKAYCEEVIGSEVEVAQVIAGSDADVLKLFYAIFEPTMSPHNGQDPVVPFTHIWILKHLTDGMGNIYPRELIHFGNLAVEKQREADRLNGQHPPTTRLISPRVLKEAFAAVSVYRCDTFLYSEFPHLAKHFDVFRGSNKATFTREELIQFFEPLSIRGDDAIRAVYDTGLLAPLGRTVDSSSSFKVPLLYRVGLGIAERGSKIRMKKEQVMGDEEEMVLELET